MTTCLFFEPNSRIPLSFLHCVQLYVDVICRVAHFKLRLVFTLSVSYFQRIAKSLNFSNYIGYSHGKTAKIRSSKWTSLKMDVAANDHVTANDRDSYWTYPHMDATANGC